MTERYRQQLDDLAKWVATTVPPEYQADKDMAMFTEAIEAVRANNPDKMFYNPDDGTEFARAYQIVRFFDLGGFVTKKDQPPPPMPEATWQYIMEPYWCIEGLVIEAENYPRRHTAEGTMQVLSTYGWVTPLEPAGPDVEPTAGPGVFTTGRSD